MRGPRIVIAGASGLVGTAAINALSRIEGAELIALSRSAPHSPVPGVRYMSLDLLDAQATATAMAGIGPVSHIVYTAVNEAPDGLVAGWTGEAQIARNGRMLEHLIEPLADGADLRRVILVHGTKAYAVHLPEQGPLPFREDMPRIEHPNFYFAQQDYLAARQRGRDWSWTIFRPSMILGGGHRSALNGLHALAVSAALCAEAGRPLAFPGNRLQPRIGEATDADLLCEAIGWALEADAAANQIFNVPNGDVFCWTDLWDWVASEYGVAVADAPDASMKADALTHQHLWEKLVERDALTGVTDLAGELASSLALLDHAVRVPRTAISSSIKLRQAGFQSCMSTEASVRKWIRVWRRDRLLP